MNLPRRFIVVVTFAILFCAIPASALNFTDYGAAPPLAKPNADANAAGLKLDYHTDLFTGSFQYQIPIKLPPARQGSEPALALSYGSSGGNGWCGVGWDLNVGYIQRETRDGVPAPGGSYVDSFGFVYSLGGSGGRLSGGAGTYYPEINRSFVKFEFAANTWMATDKGGTKYYFGGTAASQLNTARGTFRWALSKTVDANGNKTEFTYQSIDGQLYLQKIDYNANEKTPVIAATLSVEFGLQTRTDVMSSCLSGAEVQTSRRLSSITVKSGLNIVRTYALGYIYSPTTYRSLLQSVTETGNDGASLPAQTFSYQVQSTQFPSPGNWTLVAAGGGGDPYWFSIATPASALIDIDRDGKPDRVVKQYGGANNQFSVQKGNGSSFQGSFVNWNPLLNEGGSLTDDWNSLDTVYSVFMDINRDRLPDRIMRKQISQFNKFYVQLNTGSGFSSLSQWTGVTNEGGATQLGSETALGSPSGVTSDGVNTVSLLTDMNGDGFPDRVMTSKYNATFAVQQNNNGSFSGIKHWSSVAQASSQSVAGSYAPRSKDMYGEFASLIDMNGDGLPDRVYRAGGIQVQLNNGVNGFGTYLTGWNVPGASYATEINVTDGACYAILVDINGDGLPDRVKRQSSGSFVVHVNTGRGFAVNTVTWNGVSGQSYGGWDAPRAWDVNGVRVEMLDVNGDGLVDRAIRDNVNNLKVQLNPGPFPDLMNQVNNGIGASLAVSYQSTLTYGTGHKLPSHVQVVSQIVESPGGTTTYGYTGGYYDIAEREFRGFANVAMTDPLNLVTTTYFHQGDGVNQTYEYLDSKYKSGMPFRVKVGTYTDTFSTVDSASWTVGGKTVCFPFVKKVFALVQELSSSPRYTMTDYLYDIGGSVSVTTGNLLKQTDWGEVNSAGVDLPDASGPLYTTNTYATIVSNPDIRNQVDTMRITSDSAGANILRETRYEYYATTGNLYKKRERICPGTYADTVYQYDQYGNPTVVTDPVGIVTTTSYDAASATFPWRKYTGALSDNLIEYMRYDPRSGLVTDSTNVQGLVSQIVYDGLYRPKETWVSTAPNVPVSLWTTKYEYSFPNRYVKVIKRDPMDLANGLETYTYFDPWWRTIQTRIESETAGTYRVNDFVYDQRSALILVTYPRFGSGSAYVAPSGVLKCQYTEYDSKGRPYRVSPSVDRNFSSGAITVLTGDTDSLVGQTTTAFRDGTDPWATVVTDARGKERKSFRDGFNNVRQIVEVTGAGNYTTLFAYDTIGNLTNITDHALNATAMFYDELGRKVAMADPNTGYWQYRFDAGGRLKEQTDALGQKTKLYYNDPAGRVSRKEGLNSGGQIVSTITYTYDSNGGDADYTVYPGQMFKVTDDEGWTKNGYDVRGRTLKTSRYLSKNSQTYTTTSTHDDADRVETTAYPGTGAPTIRYTYDTGGNLNQVRRDDAGGPQIIYYAPKGFDAFGRLTGINFGNGVGTDYSYYPISQRLKDSITKLANNTQIQNLLNGYDQAGNITKITDSIAAHTGSASASITGTVYDDLNRLTSATWSGYGTKTYSYDAVGNTLVNGEAGAGTYNYGTARPQAVKSANGKSYTYDLNGNMRIRGQQVLNYDVYNHLIKVRSVSGHIAEFGYAGGGERLWKTSGGQLTQVWIGGHYEEKDGKVLFHVMAAGRRICTFEAAAAGATGYDPALHEFYYYHPDHLGSSSIMTERNGTEVQHYEYSAYGRDRYTSSSTAFPVSRRFTGQILDTDTGLYYYNFRYYDPELGRFIQADDIIPDLGDPQSYNRYAYCVNNPLRYTDPDGHAPEIVQFYLNSFYGQTQGLFDAGVGMMHGGAMMAVSFAAPSGSASLFYPWVNSAIDQGAGVLQGGLDKSAQAVGARNDNMTFVYSAFASEVGANVASLFVGGEAIAVGKVERTVAANMERAAVSVEKSVHRVVESGKPQFQLKKGEQGLSVFDASKVSAKDILPHFREGSGLTTKAVKEIESHGLTVERTPGHPNLPQHLQDAHMEIQKRASMTRDQFKQAIKKLEPNQQ